MIIRFLIPIIALSIVIAVHEFGHLIAAKLFKVRVEVYSIGIGKKFLSFNFRGTEYALSIVPLGGYCKLKGGDIQNPIDDEDSIDGKHPLIRAAIYLAGPLFNLILTFILLTLILLMPVHQNLPSTILPVLGQELPAEIGGLLKGDKILTINGNQITSFDDISTNIDSPELLIEVLRNESIVELKVEPQFDDGRPYIGVYPYIPLVILNDNYKDLIQGDRIVAIEDQPVDNYITLVTMIKEYETPNLTILRDNNFLDITINRDELNKMTFNNRYGNSLIHSIYHGFTKSGAMLAEMFSLFGTLFKEGDISQNISSPLRLVYDVGISIDNVYKYNTILITLESLLTIMSYISISLGFINMLPIPVLDGGQILINVITAIKGSPMSKTFITAYQTAGFIIILLLFTMGISNDIFYFGDIK